MANYRIPYIIKFDRNLTDGGINKKYLYVYVPFTVNSSEYNLKLDVRVGGNGYPQLPKELVDLTDYEKQILNLKPHKFRSRLTNVIFQLPYPIQHSLSSKVQGDLFEFEFPKAWKPPTKFWIRFKLVSTTPWTWNDNINDDWIRLSFLDGSNNRTETRFYYGTSNYSTIFYQGVGYWLSGLNWNLVDYRYYNDNHHHFVLDCIFQFDLDNKKVIPYFNGFCPKIWDIPDEKIGILQNLKKIWIDYRRKVDVKHFEIGVGDYWKGYVKNIDDEIFVLDGNKGISIISVEQDSNDTSLYHLVVGNDGSYCEVLPPTPTKEDYLNPSPYGLGKSPTYGVFLKLDITNTDLGNAIDDENAELDVQLNLEVDDTTPDYIKDYVNSITQVEGKLLCEVDLNDLNFYGVGGSPSHLANIDTKHYNFLSSYASLRYYPYFGYLDAHFTDVSKDTKIKIPHWFSYLWGGYAIRIPKNIKVYELDNIHEQNPKLVGELGVSNTPNFLLGNYETPKFEIHKSVELIGNPHLGNNVDLDIRTFLYRWYGFGSFFGRDRYWHNRIDDRNKMQHFYSWGYFYYRYFNNQYKSITKGREWEKPYHYNFDSAFELISNVNRSEDIVILDMEEEWENGNVDNTQLRLYIDPLTNPVYYRQLHKGWLIWDYETNKGLFDLMDWDKGNVKVFTYYQNLKDFHESGNSIPVYGNAGYGILYRDFLYSDNEESNDASDMELGVFPTELLWMDYSKLKGRYNADINDIRIWVDLKPFVLANNPQLFEDWTKTDFFEDGSEKLTLTLKNLHYLSNIKLDLDEHLQTTDDGNFKVELINYNKVKEYLSPTSEYEFTREGNQVPNMLYVDDYSYRITFLGTRFTNRDAQLQDFGTPYLKITDVGGNSLQKLSGENGELTITFFYEPPIERSNRRSADDGWNSHLVFAMQNINSDGSVVNGFYVSHNSSNLRIEYRHNGSQKFRFEQDWGYDRYLSKPILIACVFDTPNSKFRIYINGRLWYEANIDSDVVSDLQNWNFNQITIFGAENHKWLLDNYICGGCYGATWFTALFGNLRIFNRVLSQDEIFRLTKQLYIFPAYLLNWKRWLKRLMNMDIGQEFSLKKLGVEIQGYYGTWKIGQHLKIAFISKSQFQSGELNIEGKPYLPIIDKSGVEIVSPTNHHNTDGNPNDEKIGLLIIPDYTKIKDIIEVPALRLRMFYLRKAYYHFWNGGKLIFPNDWVGGFSINSAYDLIELEGLNEWNSYGNNGYAIGDGRARTTSNYFAMGWGYVIPNLVWSNSELIQNNQNNYIDKNKMPAYTPNLVVGGSINYYASDTDKFRNFIKHIKNTSIDDRIAKNQDLLIEYDHIITNSKKLEEILQYKPISLELLRYDAGQLGGYGSNHEGELNNRWYQNSYFHMLDTHFHYHGWLDKFYKVLIRFYVRDTDNVETDYVDKTPNLQVGIGYLDFAYSCNRNWNSGWGFSRWRNTPYYGNTNAESYHDEIYHDGFSDIYIGKEIPINKIKWVGRIFPLLTGTNYVNFNIRQQNYDWYYGGEINFYVPIIQIRDIDGNLHYFGYNQIEGRLYEITDYIEQIKANPTDSNAYNNLYNYVLDNGLYNASNLSGLNAQLQELKDKYGEGSTIAFGITFYVYNSCCRFGFFYGLGVDLQFIDTDSENQYTKQIPYLFYAPTTNSFYTEVNTTNQNEIETVVIAPTPNHYIYIKKDDNSQPKDFLNSVAYIIKHTILIP